MNWLIHHRRSEELAGAAEQALREGDTTHAEALYRAAGEAEESAFDSLDETKIRTRGITAVSAVSLLYNGRDYTAAQTLARRCLAGAALPGFAVSELQNVLQNYPMKR